MLRIYGYSKTEGLQHFSELAELTTANYDWYWVDFEKPTQDEVGLLRTYFQFHPLAIEDCLHDLQRPKIDYYDDHTFFVFHALHKKSLDRSEINLFLGEDFVVTFHKQPCEEIDSVERLLKRNNGQNNNLDEYFILYQLLDNVVDHYFPIVYEIEDHINEIEDNTKNLTMEQLLEELFDRRSELLKIRQTIHPMRDLLYRMLYTHPLEGVQERREYFADVYDHLIKAAEIVASNREMTQDIRDSYLSLNSHQTNRTMQILTVISVIFMPLTFVVGVYGMNFVNMPELETESGYYVVWFIMIAMVVTMVFWFKKKGWFD
ncbi:magnesium/cobalt transporter CorA [Halobacillus sp. B23F22_1]|uniref:magnesium/cobalt transporter CorA n=1 Tax=Halobacillus sp. B23F22_1 TaxID=3459514 RepID=UPI00373E6F54